MSIEAVRAKVMSRVEIREGCWEWQGARDRKGYGMVRSGGKLYKTHRAVMAAERGSTIPAGLCVLHTCDNPPCVNPAHLWVGTVSDNNTDKKNKGRGKSARGSTHPLAKLDEEKVAQIRERVAKGERKLHLAREYNVDHKLIERVATRKIWRHVP